jgi:hypothetical protein
MLIFSKRLSVHLRKKAVAFKVPWLYCVVFLRQWEKFFYLTVICYKLIHCQEIQWCVILTLVSMSSNPAVLIMCVLYKFERPGDKVQPAFHLFGLRHLLMCLIQPAFWPLALCVDLFLTLSTSKVFSHFSCCSKFWMLHAIKRLWVIHKHRYTFLSCSIALCMFHPTLAIVPLYHHLSWILLVSLSFHVLCTAQVILEQFSIGSYLHEE